MAQSATASASLPTVQVDMRQARLDAAIALFRSEASASGYVVEEVRLRLPVPDVDVMPRVIIAQQNSSGTTPPAFPRSKHPRFVSSNRPPASTGHNATQITDRPFRNPANTKNLGVPLNGGKEDIRTGNGLKTGSGVKRTVSGSVIFHPVAARPTSSKNEINAGTRRSQTQQKNGPLSSIPYLPTKGSSASANGSGVEDETHSTAFWKTVIGGDRGKAILRAAESMHRMRHGTNGPQFRAPFSEEKEEADKTEMELEPPTETQLQNSDNTGRPVESRGPGETRKAEEGKKANTFGTNGHSIPDSDVQLLLSSAADISAREKASPRKSSTDSTEQNPLKTFSKKQESGQSKSNGTKTASTAHGKQHVTKGRRESLDRGQSRSTVSRPFRCHKCPSSFDRDGHLRVHILAVHEKKRPFVCQVCDASFGHSSSLLRHVRTVHQATPAVGGGRHHVPSRSGSKSSESGTTKSEDLCDGLEDEGEKHFRCSACGQAFHRVALLNRHVANKHPLRPSTPDRSDDTGKSP